MKLSLKYFVIFLLNFLFFYEAKSQNYLPMLNDSQYWDVAYYDMNVIICSEFGNPGSGPYRYSLDGDTVINGTGYKKFKSYSFFSLQTQPSPNCSPFAIDTIPSPSWNILFFMREDTVSKKVFRYDIVDLQEYLWYDFDAQIGDTIHYPELGDFIIDTTYNIITLDGKTRKYFGCNNSPSNLCAYYIEGLGGVGGPFHEPFNIFEFGPWMMCISDLNQNSIYSPVGVSNCYNFITNVESIGNHPNSITLFPNPVEDYLSFTNLPLNSGILIFDIFGREIANYENVISNRISTQNLVQGIYFVCYKKQSTTYSIGKFIMN